MNSMLFSHFYVGFPTGIESFVAPQVAVISDEIYERLTYDGTVHTSFATLPGMFSRTVTVNGFSKSHSMTGYRLGYAAAPLHIAQAMSKVQSQLTSCASSVAQYAACAALQHMPRSNPTWMADRVAELQCKRDLAHSLLCDIPHVTCPKSMGAFYLLPDVSHYFSKRNPASGKVISNSHDLCLELLEGHRVALVPGDAFGAPRCVRISYAAQTEIITGALQRLRTFLLSLTEV